jgi:hypothetical protein
MNAGTWIAALGVIVAVLTLLVTAQWRSNDIIRKERDDERAKNEKLESENKLLFTSNVDLKIANATLNTVGDALERTLSALPIQRTGGTP